MAILEIKNVSKFFGGLAANSDVSFELEQGMIMGLIGPKRRRKDHPVQLHHRLLSAFQRRDHLRR